MTTRNSRPWLACRRLAIGLGAVLALVPLGAAVGASGPTAGAPRQDELRDAWRPALGADGPTVLDRLVSVSTPPCYVPRSVADLARKIRELRSVMLQGMGLDLDARVRSAELQRTHRRNGYRIDVVRVETLQGLYLPVNVYVPDLPGDRRAPLVVSPTGCGSATWSAAVQDRAANLALRGIVVVIAEGFCDNGSRAAGPDGHAVRPQTDYARQLIGLPGAPFSVFLQELISTISWAVETYPRIDPERIGVAGYSYGGQTALYLAQVDRRVRSVSIPATYLGNDCAAFRLNSDIAIESRDADFVWSAPPELPLQAVNWRVLMLYPRPLHTIAGAADAGATPRVIGPAMDYAATLYALGEHTDRLEFSSDAGAHHYGRTRREGTYRWLTHTLTGAPLQPHSEQRIDRLGRSDLAVDISGTRSMEDDLLQAIEAERRVRFRDRRPPDAVAAKVASAMAELYPALAPEPVHVRTTWRIERSGVSVEAKAARTARVEFPVFVFRSPRGRPGTTLLYLPERGTLDELEGILARLDEYETVVSVDYPGVGETRSDRVMLHTVARYFMHGEWPLPRLAVESLRSWVKAHGASRIDLHGRGWASAMIGLMLTALESERIGDVVVERIPDDELAELASGRKVPDLLLWGGLFSRLTVRELVVALKRGRRIAVSDSSDGSGDRSAP